MDLRQSLRSQLLRELAPIEIETSLWPEYEATRPQYVPYGAAKIIQEIEDREVLVSGPAGPGKTRAILEKIHRLAKEYPGSRYLVVRKTRESLNESVLQIFERWVLGPGHPMLRDAPRRNNRKVYYYPNGSEIVVGGMDKPGKIMSTEYDIIGAFEAVEFTEEDWENFTSRLRNFVLPFQQLIADTNPSYPNHWLKLRCNEGKTTLIEARHEDNPRLYNNKLGTWTAEGRAYIATLDALTGVRKQRLRYGKWVRAEGIIYENYDPAVHLIDRFEIPDHWRKFRVVDFGYVNPFVCAWFALDEDDRMYLYRYIYMTGRTVRAHAEQIVKLSEGDKMLDPRIVCDHDAEDQATLKEAGLKTLNADKRVRVGIEAVMDRLKVQDDGRPRLFILRDSLVEVDRSLQERKKPWRIEDEFESYVWANKEAPVKEDDHGLDVIRYGVMAVDKRKKAEIDIRTLTVQV